MIEHHLHQKCTALEHVGARDVAIAAEDAVVAGFLTVPVRHRFVVPGLVRVLLLPELRGAAVVGLSQASQSLSCSHKEARRAGHLAHLTITVDAGKSHGGRKLSFAF